MKIQNGDIFDIGQTINGVSRFIMFGDKWHYFEKRLNRVYEYSQDDLTETVLNKDGLEDITFVGNVFDHISNK